MMVSINLLPHREAKRKERRDAFLVSMVASMLVGAVLVMAVGGVISAQIASQQELNSLFKEENAKLDIQIAEIATLQQEIAALKARQQAVEDLQSDRNQPVYLMDELVKHVPKGSYLRSFKQSGQRVVLNGYAQSNERVSELLRNIGNASPWLQQPDLVEIRAATVGQDKYPRKLFEFTVNAGIKRAAQTETVTGTPAGGARQQP